MARDWCPIQGTGMQDRDKLAWGKALRIPLARCSLMDPRTMAGVTQPVDPRPSGREENRIGQPCPTTAAALVFDPGWPGSAWASRRSTRA